MKRSAKCRYGAFLHCTRPAVRTIKQKPYCEYHAVIVERVHRNVEKHRELLERLASPEPETSEPEQCGSFGCTLPKGHNMGRADIPENHGAAAESGLS